MLIKKGQSYFPVLDFSAKGYGPDAIKSSCQPCPEPGERQNVIYVATCGSCYLDGLVDLSLRGVVVSVIESFSPVTEI